MVYKVTITPAVTASLPALDADLLSGVPLELLPPMAQDVMAACGPQAAAKLLLWQPSARLCVPKLAEPEHVLAEVMGWAGYKGLVARYGGQRIALPRCEKLVRALRNVAILRAYAKGHSVNDLAVRYGMVARAIERVLAAPGLLDADMQMGGVGLAGEVDARQMALAL
jgi:hypothetical protein